MKIAIALAFIAASSSTALLALLLPCAAASAQSGLPAPSRTIYKCTVKGTVSYSDEPCVGAQRLDVTPSRGVDRLSGASRINKDVANEIHAEQFAGALRPLTGMNPSQFATAVRRNNLEPAARQECGRLESAILELEQAERRADAAAIKPIQQDLYTSRKRYKTLRC